MKIIWKSQNFSFLLTEFLLSEVISVLFWLNYHPVLQDSFLSMCNLQVAHSLGSYKTDYFTDNQFQFTSWTQIHRIGQMDPK